MLSDVWLPVLHLSFEHELVIEYLCECSNKRGRCDNCPYLTRCRKLYDSYVDDDNPVTQPGQFIDQFKTLIPA